MKARVIGTILFTVLVVAAPSARPQASATAGQTPTTAKPPAAKRAVIVTGENSFNGHVWKDTSAEIKSILDAGKDFQDVVIQPDPNFIASDEFLTFDVAIFDFRNQNPLAQDEKVQANLLKFLGQPKGLVTVHWANGAFPYWPEYINIVGRAQQSVHDPRGAFMFEAAVQRCRRPLRDVDKRQLLPPHDPQVAHSKATALALCFASGSMSANCPM